MARRPKITDTEEDLLRFQESFLSSGEKPSVSIKVLAGEKRKVEESVPGTTIEEGRRARDVVTLNTEGKPQVKKSRFRERKENLMKQGKRQDPMEVQGDAACQVLTDVQEHRYVGPPITMTALQTKHGFPVVKELDFTLASRGTGASRPKMKKKSLFATQFEDKTLDFFGIDSDPLAEAGGDSRSWKGDVELTLLGTETSQACGGDGAMESEGRVEEGDGNEGRESSPAVLCDWLKSGLVLEEGPQTEEEITMDGIHEENVSILSRLSEEDILQKKEQLEKALPPDLVAFIKSRRGHSKIVKNSKIVEKSGKEETQCSSNESEMETSCMSEQHPEEARNTGATSRLLPPGGWLHMDVVEREKLEWMVDVSHNAPNSSRLELDKLDKIETRFSLDGLVIPRGANVPSHLGLHHHGDEPEAAGYSLAELLPLCRSTVLQQRVLSLQALSRILRRARQREYEGLVEGSIVGTLVEAQLPLLLRFSLDESAEAAVMAAVQVMHDLLVVAAEEAMLNEFSLCYSGNFLPALTPHSVPEAERKGGETEEEEKEADILQRDIIAGYLRMNILPRLRYLLEVFLPVEPPVMHRQLLEVLTRIARHSVASATQVVECPRLMRVVFERHLPLCWSAAGEGDGTARPQVAALRLVKALCTAGRNLAKRLLSDYSLMSVLTCYAVLLPSEQNLALEEAYCLATVALGTWQVLLCYGLSDGAFRDVFPVFLKQMQLLTSMTSPSSPESRRVASLLGLAESGVCVAAVMPEQLKLGGSEMLPSPAVVWGHATGMAAPLMHALTVWTRERTNEGPGMVDAILIIGNILHFLATYFSKLQPKAGKEPEPLRVLEQVEALETVLSQLLQSWLLTKALHVIRDSGGPSSNVEHTSLPSHFTPSAPTQRALYGSDRHSVVSRQIGLPHGEDVLLRCTNLVDGFARLCLACMQLHRGMLERVAIAVFTCPAYHQMLDVCLSREGEVLLTGYIKSRLLHSSVKIFVMWAEAYSGSVDRDLVSLMQAISFRLLATLPAGLESIGRDLYSSVIFHPVFYRNLEGVVKCDYLKILDPKFPMRGHSFGPVSRTTLLYPSWKVLAPVDWILSPLREGIQASKRRDTDKALVKHALSFLLLLEQQHPLVLSGLCMASRIASVMCVFLMDGALFLEPPFRSLLQALLELYVTEDVMSRVSLTSPIPGFPSFRDLYLSFLEDFAAVSYGDHLFGSFVLLPLGQRFPVGLRQMVWGDHSHILRLLSAPLDQFALDVRHFLYPPETDGELIERYMSAIASGQVRKTINPLPYLIAVHHIHSYVFSVRRKKLLLGILLLKDQVVRGDLLLYSGYEPSSPAGFERTSVMKDEVKHFISMAEEA